MMELQERIQLISEIGKHLGSDDANWLAAKERASRENPWFIPEFIDHAVTQICQQFLQAAALAAWAKQYGLPAATPSPKTVGLVTAGNIPLVGFHDLLCIFISGHKALIKPSSKDSILLKYIVNKMAELDARVNDLIQFQEQLKNCDAYIATGGNNTSRYFSYYFGKYPHIIRKNRTSVAVLDGTESAEELEALGKDIMMYFGMGCRNITQVYVPKEYDFIPLLKTLESYLHYTEHHSYKHNYDYHLTLLIMNNKYYMNNGVVVMQEHESPFSPVSHLHYQYYDDAATLLAKLKKHQDIQCVVGHGALPFGSAQEPSLTDYADGVDTMAFLAGL